MCDLKRLIENLEKAESLTIASYTEYLISRSTRAELIEALKIGLQQQETNSVFHVETVNGLETLKEYLISEGDMPFIPNIDRAIEALKNE